MKNSSIVLLLLAAVLVGTAGAATAGYLWLGSVQLQSESRGPAPLRDNADATVSARIDALVQENRELRRRLEELELRPAPAARTAVDGFATVEQLDSLREQLEASLANRGALAAEPEALKEHVAGALIELRHEEAVDAVRSYQEKRAARLDDDVAKMTDWLGLDDYQAQDLRNVLTAQYDREEEVRLLWEDGVEDDLLGRRKDEDRALFYNDLEGVLEPEQLETFWGTTVGGRGKGEDG